MRDGLWSFGVNEPLRHWLPCQCGLLDHAIQRLVGRAQFAEVRRRCRQRTPVRPAHAFVLSVAEDSAASRCSPETQQRVDALFRQGAEPILVLHVQQVLAFDAVVHEEHRRIQPQRFAVTAQAETENADRLGVVFVAVDQLETDHVRDQRGCAITQIGKRQLRERFLELRFLVLAGTGTAVGLLQATCKQLSLLGQAAIAEPNAANCVRHAGTLLLRLIIIEVGAECGELIGHRVL